MCEEENGDIIKLLWTNRNKDKRESYRQLMNQATPEEQWTNTEKMADKTGIEVLIEMEDKQEKARSEKEWTNVGAGGKKEKKDKSKQN